MKHITYISLCIALMIGFVLQVNVNTKQERTIKNMEQRLEQQSETILEQEQSVLDMEQALKETKEQSKKELQEKQIIIQEKEQQLQRLEKRLKELQSELDKYAGVFNVTHYDALCDTGCTGVTATGLDVTEQTTYDGMAIIATDPNVIPLGTIVEMEIDGQVQKAISLDTGGDIKGNRIDVLVENTTIAYELGYQKNIPVKIIGHINL
jgi:3D (Asp-Asp-Asp) domain-containing protein